MPEGELRYDADMGHCQWVTDRHRICPVVPLVPIGIIVCSVGSDSPADTTGCTYRSVALGPKGSWLGVQVAGAELAPTAADQ